MKCLLFVEVGNEEEKRKIPFGSFYMNEASTKESIDN